MFHTVSLLQYFVYHLNLKIAHFAEPNMQRYCHFMLFDKKNWHALQIIRKDEVFHGLLFSIILQSVEILSHPVTVLSSRIWSVAYQRPFLQRQRYQENHAAFWSPTQTWIGQTPSQ